MQAVEAKHGGALDKATKTGLARRWRARICGVACSMAVVAAVVTPPVGAAQPAAHAAVACPTVDFIGARGSGEPQGKYGGLGPEVSLMNKQLQAAFPGATGLHTTPVEDGYTAESDLKLRPSGGEEVLLAGGATGVAAAVLEWKKNHLDPFLASIATGATATLAYVGAEVARCPSTAIVLGGYSQGAMAIHQAELQMSRGMRSHIAGTILLADGDRTPNTAAAYTLGTSPARGEGVRSYLGMNSGRDVPLPGSTVDICDSHDMICDFTSGAILSYSRDLQVHGAYASGPLPRIAAHWVAQRILSQQHPAPGGGPSGGSAGGGTSGGSSGEGGGGGLTIGGVPAGALAETTGGVVNTWTDSSDAGGTAGPQIPSNATVGVECKISGFRVADGNTWWYQIASTPWSDSYYASADAFYNNGATSGPLSGTPFDDPSVPSCSGSQQPASGAGTFSETVGGVAHTWTNYSNAGGTEGPAIQSNQTVQITCKVNGFQVADGNTWWYKIASSPWSNAYYVSADAFYNNGQTSGSLIGTPFDDPNVPDCAGSPPPPPPPPAPSYGETTGGVAHTWTNYSNAGGTEGPEIGSNQTVQIACKLTGFQVADGNTWWYRIASSPWNSAYYVSADAFYNNGQTSGSLHGTPFDDPNVPNC